MNPDSSAHWLGAPQAFALCPTCGQLRDCNTFQFAARPLSSSSTRSLESRPSIRCESCVAQDQMQNLRLRPSSQPHEHDGTLSHHFETLSDPHISSRVEEVDDRSASTHDLVGKDRMLLSRGHISVDNKLPSDGDIIHEPHAHATAPSLAGRVSFHHAVPVIDLRPAQQIQMLSDFLHSHFPTAEAKASLTSRRSYLAALPDTDLSSSPMLRFAVETLCYAHIGAKIHDDRLIRESQFSYGKVLTALRRDIDRRSSLVPSTASKFTSQSLIIESRALLTSIMLLCMYDDAIPIPDAGENNWVAHYWGCQQILQLFGPSMLNICDPFTRLIYWNLRMPCFFLGIARRQRIAFGRPDWIAHANTSHHNKGPMKEFYLVSMILPELLERTDQVLSPFLPWSSPSVRSTSSSPYASSSSSSNPASSVHDAELKHLIADIEQTRSAIDAWLNKTVQDLSEPGRPNPEVAIYVPVDDGDAFDMTIEEHVVMTTSTVFSSVINFEGAGFLIRYHTLRGVCNLILDCTLLRIYHFISQSFNGQSKSPPLSSFAYRSPATVLADARATARCIIQSIYHFTNGSNQNALSLPMADFTEFLIELCLNFFEEDVAEREMGYCQALRCATRLRIERIQASIQKRTLCRMRDVGPGCVLATRWKSRTVGWNGG